MKKSFFRFLSWVPALAVMALIFYFSSKSGGESSAQSDPIAAGLGSLFGLGSEWLHFLIVLVRKSGHFLEFAALSFCFGFAFAVQGASNRQVLVWGILISYAYALTDEFHQLFVPERSGRFSDTLVDLMGICAGIFVFLVILNFWRKKKQPK